MSASHSFKYIVNIRTRIGRDIINEVMPTAPLFRVQAADATRLVKPRSTMQRRLWVDPGLDGFDYISKHGWKRESAWRDWIRSIPKYDCILESHPSRTSIRDFTHGLCSAMHAMHPSLMSVPQLSYSPSKIPSSTNKILAKATGDWTSNAPKRTPLIIPLILNGHDCYRLKTGRNAIIKCVRQVADACGATSIWVVDTCLDDLAVSRDEEQRLFEDFLILHTELRTAMPDLEIFGGPYWATNLVLWARELIDGPVIGCGAGYRYFSPRPMFSRGTKVRIAIPPLRRLYTANEELRNWLREASDQFSSNDPARREFKQLATHLRTLQNSKRAGIRQSVVFYKEWLDKLLAVDSRGRAVYLFQDFSNATVLGSQIINKLPRDSGASARIREPGHIARQFMFHCLSR